MAMRIGIEGLSLLFHRTGTSTYTHELVQNLRRLGLGDTVVLFSRNQGSAGGSYHDISYTDRVANLFYKDYRLPWKLAAERIDIYHSPRDMGLPGPGRLPCPSVVTLHDIILVRLARDYYSTSRARLYEHRLRTCLSGADHVITISEFSRNDILDWSGLDPDKISVISDGVSADFKPVQNEELLEEVRQRYGLPRRYIICVGSTEPRKNVRRAIEAYNQLRRVEPAVGLVITGVDYCGVGPNEAFAGLPLDGVTMAGYVREADMPLVVGGAELLFFPSLYEGFGLPPLEAMACGVPVVTSSVSSLPEVVGDAAVLVDPLSISGMASALEMVLGSEDFKTELVRKGHDRARQFSWRRTAAETRRIYEKVLRTT